MKIYHNGTPILDIAVNDNSYRYRAIKGENSLTLYYSLAEHIELPIGAYCIFENETYTLEKPENLSMKHSRNFEYTVIFDAPQAKAAKFKFRNPVDRRLKFSLTAKPKEHLQMFVDNMNMRDNGWSIGECIDAPEKVISYNHAFCMDALKLQAETFETEYEFVGKRVSLRKIEYNKDNPLPLSYGKGNGFKPGIGRTNFEDSVPIEILYLQGGTENIDTGKYGGSELLLPQKQTIKFDGTRFEDEPGFTKEYARTYITDADGFSIRRAYKNPTTFAEDSLDCSEIYPKRVGEVSSVVEVNASKNFFDFIDATIPASLNFNDYLIDGETMTVIFQTGMLAGREFEVKYIHEAKNGKDARRFEITPQEIDGITMPGGSYMPKAGDTYAVFNCMLPDAYICDNATKSGASWEMFRKGVRYLYDNEEQKFSFTGELDGIWAKKDWINIGGRIKLGGYVRFSDEHFQKDAVLVRIIGIKEFINNPHSPEIELSNSPVGKSVSTSIKQLESNEVVMEDLHQSAIQFTKRRYRDAKETIDMLKDAMLENFTGSISPVAVQTMAMLVGDESLQFQFVNNTTAPEQIAHNVVYDTEKKVLSSPAGIIQHLTIGIKSLSSSHAADEYKYWAMEAFESPTLTDSKQKYYLYAKVSKTAPTGVFYMSETAIALEGVSGYYHLLMGILNSEFEGVRSYVSLYGFTEILPGRVTTDKIVSGTGTSYFDMLNDAMKLGKALDFNSQGDGRLRLKGTIVQSESGDESPVGVYRGAYNSEYTYYNGDEVVFTVAGITSTYRYTHSRPSKGIEPTNTSYWQVQAAGVKGDKGDKGDKGEQGEQGLQGLQGEQGEQGIPGSDGADGRTSYFHIKYAPVENPTAEQMTETPSSYVGTYVDFSEEDSTDPARYTWARFQGFDGEQGIPGINGENGKTSYLHIKYSNDGGQTFSSNTGLRLVKFNSLRLTGRGGFRFTDDNLGDVPGSYIGTYVDYDPTDSNDVFRYKWVKVKGEQGSKGDVGDYYEYRYAKNGSTTTPPAIEKTALNPDGWDKTVPVIGDLEYLWTTIGKISGDGTTLLQEWSTPVRFTPKDGVDGKQGESPALVFRGMYNASETYYGNKYRVDAVKYGEAYYVARIDAGTFSGTLPTSTAKWNSFGASFESVATNLLLAENANLAGFIFKDNTLISQQNGKDGKPKLMLDGVNGKVRSQDGTFYGSFATPPAIIPNGSSSLTLSFETGFNFTGKLPAGSSRSIKLPVDAKYDGVECSIINYGDIGGGYYNISTSNGSAFLYTGKSNSIDNINKIYLYGCARLALKAILINSSLKWFIINYNDFSYNYIDKALTNKIARPTMKCIGVYTVNSGTSLVEELCTDGNKLSMTKTADGRWNFKFASARKNKNYAIIEVNNTTAGRVQAYNITNTGFSLMCTVYLVIINQGDFYYYNPSSFRFYIIEYDL